MSRLHFANSATLHVRQGLVQAGGSLRRKVALQTRYGLFQHPLEGLVLIDTGYSSAVTQGAGRSVALKAYAAVLRPNLLTEGTIPAVLSRLGAGLDDIRTVILTHLHADHVAGLSLLPHARLIVSRQAAQPVLSGGRLSNLSHGVFTELLPPDFAHRLTCLEDRPMAAAPDGRADGRDLLGDGSVIAFPLPGHASGHVGLWFPMTEGSPVYGCDAAWMAGDLDHGDLPGLPARLILHSARDARQSLQRLAALKAAGHPVILCHDPQVSAYDLPLQDRP